MTTFRKQADNSRQSPRDAHSFLLYLAEVFMKESLTFLWLAKP